MKLVLLAFVLLVGCGSPPEALPVAEPRAQADKVPDLEKRLAKLEADLQKHRGVIIQLGGEIDFVRKAAHEAVGDDRWGYVREPSAQSIAENGLNDAEEK